jgi:alpha-glucuronidase
MHQDANVPLTYLQHKGHSSTCKFNDMKYRIFSLFYIAIVFVTQMAAEDGSHLGLRLPVNAHAEISAPRQSPTLNIAVEELQQAWKGAPVRLVIQKDKQLQAEGFRIRHEDNKITLTSPTETGLLYAAYHLLRMQETGQNVVEAQTTENPAYNLRILNHWDNMDRTVERGYAGQSLWNWEELPNTLSDRYKEYARANASIGINGTVLNNVNASPKILSAEYLQKVKALADIFRPYGLRVYLSVNFASPMALDSLSTADPLDKEVIRWWKNKVKEIYRIIPDFGGFLVKANSEGQPGPCDFGRTHAEGANMLADALKPYKGIVMWRAFVYSPSDADRAKQAYLEFEPLDGQFRNNVIVQVKNGPIDFQPREPYSPLFGAMQHTPLMAEFQVTQEYLGHSNHLAYLAPMWKEFFEFVAPASLKAVAGVANIGTDANWCGHTFAQANWYAFGRLAWQPSLSSGNIADEWLKQTFGSQPSDISAQLKKMMLDSHEAVVNYMMPLGLHHIFAWGHHYGPEPWCSIPGARPDWLPSYYHRADKQGIGFDRSSKGSNAVAQYPETLAKQYDNIDTCPEEYLLWFHHVPWSHRMKSGRSLWDELCHHYDNGVRQVRDFQKIWDAAEKYIDAERFHEVQSKLKIQARDAVWWKDACLLYFQEFSGMPIPYEIERPIHELKDLQKVHLPISNYECPTKELLNKNR